MKKVLFVLGFAMCATFAMAQTNRTINNVDRSNRMAFNPAATAQQPVDYKASIFTKDDDVVLGSFNFATAPSTGVMSATDRINDTVITSTNAHNRDGVTNYWNHIADSAALLTSAYAQNPNGVYNYRNFIWRFMGARNGITDDNGFMLLSLSEVTGNYNAIHCWFMLPAVNLDNAQIVDVRWRQAYANYYDECYIDYQKNGSWYAVEVNVDGVDVAINGTTGYGQRVATLPMDAVEGQQTLQIRFRSFADGTTRAYGYFWAIDNVEIVKVNTPNRWSFSNVSYLNGFYGTMPQGFNVPLSYVMYGRNRSFADITNVTLSADGMVGDATTGTTFISRTQGNMPAGDPNLNYLLSFNESGYMIPDEGDVWGQAFPWNYHTNYNVPDDTLAARGYGRLGLPTEVTGKNRFAIKVANAQGQVRELDTIAYTVSENLEVNAEYGRTVPGYRWAHDNGYVPGGSEFAYQFTTNPEDASSNGYVTSEPEYGQNHQYAKGYYMYTRYNSPSVIPTDENGNPWVLRGIEYVTSTKLTAVASGATINPLMLKMDYQGDPTNSDNWGLYYMNTGLAQDEVVQATAASYAPTVDDNYGAYTPDQNQRVLNVLFPAQPAIEPNAMYVVGFENLVDQGYAVARTDYQFQVTADSAVSYANPNQSYVDPDFYNQITPTGKAYDAIAYDPLQSSRGNANAHSINGGNIDYYPMIRLIVGPKLHIDSVEVFLNCGDEDSDEYWVYGYRTNICGMHDTLPKGSSVSYYFFPGNAGEFEQVSDDNEYYVYDSTSEFMPSRILTDILDNGVSVGDINDTTNPNVSMVDYTVYHNGHQPGTGEEEWAPALVRYGYLYTVRNLQENHELTARTTTQELGIGGAEDLVSLTLAPNPATSQVRLNVAGIGGKINCSIIDMSGRVVYNTEVNAGENTLNLNGIPAGAYFVRVTNSAVSKVEKLIIR